MKVIITSSNMINADKNKEEKYEKEIIDDKKIEIKDDKKIEINADKQEKLMDEKKELIIM